MKGEAERILASCDAPPADAAATLDRALRATAPRHRGRRSATRPGLATAPTDADEQHLEFVGFLVFVDRPKADAGRVAGASRPARASW